MHDESAFPHNRDVSHEQLWENNPGMSLLDYFAGQAMQGKLAACTDTTYPAYDAGELAKDSYAYADAMLAERARRAALAAV
jgi:hypothetical protein